MIDLCPFFNNRWSSLALHINPVYNFCVFAKAPLTLKGNNFPFAAITTAFFKDVPAYFSRKMKKNTVKFCTAPQKNKNKM